MANLKRIDQSGMTLVELVIASAIMATMASTVILARSLMAKQSVNTNDRAFAAQKAIQMFQELRALAYGNENNVTVLDSYGNGSQYDNVLTTDKTVDTGTAAANPANALSGNIQTDGNWRYLRQVQVNHLPYNVYLRQVIVKVWRYASDQNPTQPGQQLAEVDGILGTSADNPPPTQVMDVYVLAINNIAAWWDQEWNLYSDFQQIISSMSGNNIPGGSSSNGSTPGLQFRPHYITRSSYGRDLDYVPYSNNALSTDTATSGGAIPWVYFYPGNTPEDAADGGGAGNFYDPIAGSPGFLGYDGKVNVDGANINPSSGAGVGVTYYTMADQYNNSVRYPDEQAIYQAVTNAAGPNDTLSDPLTEISERMLFEDMLSEPQSFENALIVNLHGECLPLPPMRNYSDAAKDPTSTDNANDTNIRVVTHPEMLYYPSAVGGSSVTVRLRVYAYYDGFDNPVSLDASDPATLDPKVPGISVYLPDLSLSPSNVMTITAVIGNDKGTAVSVGGPITYSFDNLTTTNTSFPATYVSPSGTTDPNGIQSGTANLSSPTYGTPAGPVTAVVNNVGPNNQTVIELYNTRLRCTQASNSSGLNPADRLYGLEYIPCSPDETSLAGASPLYTFTGQPLTFTGAGPGDPKNTARWIITLSVPVSQVFAGVSSTSPLTVMASPVVQAYTGPVTFAGRHTIETRINILSGTATDAVTQVPYNYAYSNLSRTYVWTGDSTSVPYGNNTISCFPPTTEQYQFLGDPRDEPYLDVKVGGPNNAGQAGTIAANGYNWWFKDGAKDTAVTPNMYTDGYLGFSAAQTTNGWAGTGVTSNSFEDLPRFYQVIRSALLNTTSIWTAMNGWTYYYFGFGGEFGSNQPPFSNGLDINTTLYNTTAQAAVTYVSEMYNWNGAACPVTDVRIPENTTNTWYARTWMGELYPDSQAAEWQAHGNLPTNQTATASNSTFYRQDYANLATTGYTYGTTNISTGNGGDSLTGLGRTQTNAAGPNGCCAFYNGTCASGANTLTSNGQMNHLAASNDSTDTATALAVTCYNIFTFPLAPSIENTDGDMRPWHLSDSQTSPEWNLPPYNAATMRTALNIPEVSSDDEYRLFYTSDQGSDWQGTGVVQIQGTVTVGGSAVTQYAYVVESGLAIAANVGTNTLGETAMILMLRTFLDGGNYSGNAHITQVPLVEMYCDSPTLQYSQPSSINLVVDGAVTTGNSETIDGITIISGPTTNLWFRFPGQTSETANFYTEEYPGYNVLANSTYSETANGEPLTLDMNLLYSSNDTESWQYIQDNSPANFGTLNTGSTYLISTNSFPVTYQWAVPATSASVTFGQGTYYVAVEAYRHNDPLDYAWHELPILINR